MKLMWIAVLLLPVMLGCASDRCTDEYAAASDPACAATTTRVTNRTPQYSPQNNYPQEAPYYDPYQGGGYYAPNQQQQQQQGGMYPPPGYGYGF